MDCKSRGEALSEDVSAFARFPVVVLSLVGLLVVAGARCQFSQTRPERKPGGRQIQPVYSVDTGRLRLLTFDRNTNGKVEAWAYMEGARIVRIEIDRDENGSLDRWEYYGPDAQLQKVGFSRANDGKVDAWAFQGPDRTLARIDVSSRRDGQINRTEFYEHGVLDRVEEDSDGDGRVDRWETYREGVLTVLALDTRLRGAPDHRLVYDPAGTQVESDPDGDGLFRIVSGAR